jgi:hypothetical protein
MPTNIHILEEVHQGGGKQSTHLELSGDEVPPYHTGTKKASDKMIKLRNLTNHKIRLCFIAQDNRAITDYFDTPVNIDTTVPNNRAGWVELAARPSSGQATINTMILRDTAWAPNNAQGRPVDRQLRVSANLHSAGVCATGVGLAHLQDIIIDGGE